MSQHRLLTAGGQASTPGSTLVAQVDFALRSHALKSRSVSSLPVILADDVARGQVRQVPRCVLPCATPPGLSAARPATGTPGREAQPERDLSITWMGAGLPPSARLLLAGVTQCFGRELQLVDSRRSRLKKASKKLPSCISNRQLRAGSAFRHPCSRKNFTPCLMTAKRRSNLDHG